MKDAGIIDIDGFKLKYLAEGNGSDVLVIGSSIYYSRTFSQNLRKFVRLHFIDYRGFAEGPEVELTFDTLLDDIEYVRRGLGLSKCIVVGHSVHGLLALEYAKKYKEHVSHCVMIGTPPDMRERGFAMAQENWEEFASSERKEAFELNVTQMPDEVLNRLPRDKWFVKMNIRNAPKSWYNYNFDSGYLWEGVQPNVNVLDQMYLKFAREVDVSQGLESFDLPVLLAYGRFEFLVAPVHSWDFLRNKFSQLNICIFENSAHSPHYEESERFDDQLLKWLSAEKF